MTIPAAIADRAAALTEVSGLSLVAHFGSTDREYEAAREACALAPRPWRSIVRVTGDDRRSFLQGLLSNDIEGLAVGLGCRALFLDVKGHVRADLDVWAEEDALVLGGDAVAIERALPDLQKYVLGAAVTFEDRRDEEVVVGLIGPQADVLLVAAGVDPPDATDRAHVSVALADTVVRLARTRSLGAPGVEAHVPAPQAGAVLELLEEASTESRPAYAGWEASEILRVESGWPRTDCEITGAEFPQEAAMDDAVDYEKGCYLGQETVARIHYRGRVNRLLSGLRFDGDVAPGADLVRSGRDIGRVTSAVVSPAHGPIGLGYVRRPEEDGEAEVVEVHAAGAAICGATIMTLPFSE